MANTNSIEKEKERKRLASQIQEYLKSGKTITKVPPGEGAFESKAAEITRRRLWKQE